MPTASEIEAKRTAKGGYTKAQLAEWGVPWPPPKGWKRRLEQCSAHAVKRCRSGKTSSGGT